MHVTAGQPPVDVQTLMERALRHQQASQVSQALTLFRSAAVVDPGHAGAYHGAGKIQFDRRRFGESLVHFRRETMLDPRVASAWANMAACRQLLGRHAEASAAYRAAVCLRPEGAVAYSNLGSVLKDVGLLPESRRCYVRALRLDPARPEAYQNFGNSFEKAEAPEEAVAQYRAAVCVDPAYMPAYANLGTLLQHLGRLDDAALAYDQALSIAPHSGSTYLYRVGLYQNPVAQQTIATMERLVRDESLEPAERTQIHFALGDVYERRKDFDSSFSHYAAGNALKRNSFDYDGGEHVHFLKRAAEAFPAGVFDEFRGMGHLADQPVFLIGMPRSGSTLTEQILASHPDVHGAGERSEFVELVYDALRYRFPDIPSFVASLTGGELERIGADYAGKMRALAPQARRITDKMPGNFLFAGLIHLALPNAKIIHCRRDPVDTCLSCFSKLFIDSQLWSYDLAELGRYYRAYESVMDHWRTVLPDGVMLEVQYEDVVADLEGQARRIIAHCGLDWDPRCLAFYDTERPVRTASASQVRQPIYKGAVERWRRYERHLQPLLDALNDSQGGEMPQIKIDDFVHDIDTLPETARQHVTSLQFVDAEIQRLQMQLAMAQTARNAYSAALREALKETGQSGTKA